MENMERFMHYGEKVPALWRIYAFGKKLKLFPRSSFLYGYFINEIENFLPLVRHFLPLVRYKFTAPR